MTLYIDPQHGIAVREHVGSGFEEFILEPMTQTPEESRLGMIVSRIEILLEDPTLTPREKALLKARERQAARAWSMELCKR